VILAWTFLSIQAPSASAVQPQVAAGEEHIVGLKSDGIVVAWGINSFGQMDVGGWTDIVQVAAGAVHTVGLKSDGTVVAVGSHSLQPELHCPRLVSLRPSSGSNISNELPIGDFRFCCH
jgi:alpha-tubulin suppressor-like RCC1 family protein